MCIRLCALLSIWSRAFGLEPFIRAFTLLLSGEWTVLLGPLGILVILGWASCLYMGFIHAEAADSMVHKLFVGSGCCHLLVISTLATHVFGHQVLTTERQSRVARAVRIAFRTYFSLHILCDPGSEIYPEYALIIDALLLMYEGHDAFDALLWYYRVLMFWAGLQKLNPLFPGTMGAFYTQLAAPFWPDIAYVPPKSFAFVACMCEIALPWLIGSRRYPWIGLVPALFHLHLAAVFIGATLMRALAHTMMQSTTASNLAVSFFWQLGTASMVTFVAVLWNMVWVVAAYILCLRANPQSHVRTLTPKVDKFQFALVAFFAIVPILTMDFNAYIPSHWYFHMWDGHEHNEAWYRVDHCITLSSDVGTNTAQFGRQLLRLYPATSWSGEGWWICTTGIKCVLANRTWEECPMLYRDALHLSKRYAVMLAQRLGCTRGNHVILYFRTGTTLLDSWRHEASYACTAETCQEHNIT